MSIATAIAAAQAKVAAAYSKCNDKGATMPQTQNLSNLANCIDSIQAGGGGNAEAEENDVIFIDYDGTIRYSYSAQDFLALTAMPANPTHPGLISQGWNWTLSDAQAYVTKYVELVIGQNYVPTDGKTHIFISINYAICTNVRLNFGQSVSQGLSIDWGDGSTPETVEGTGNIYTTHTYPEYGEYEIILTVLDGTITLGKTPNYSCLLFSEKGDSSESEYATLLQKIYIGPDISLGYNSLKTFSHYIAVTFPSNNVAACNGAWIQSGRVKSMTYPSGSTSTGYGSPGPKCSSGFVSFPKSLTSMARDFENGWFRKLTLSGDLTAIGNFICHTLRRFRVPEHITSLGYSVNSSGLRELIMYPTTPPTATSFSNWSADLKIYVPYSPDHSVLAAYKAATGWIGFTNQIYELDSNGNIPTS